MNSDEKQQCNLHREPALGESINIIMKHIQFSRKKAFYSNCQELLRSQKWHNIQVTCFSP